MNINLNALRVFSVAARYGNFQHAAKDLNVSHGAVSQRIKQLELDLGVILFERKPRGVVLTQKGQRYFDAVQEAFSILKTATSELEPSQSCITLHLGPSFAAKWFMPRMTSFRARYPDISLATQVHDELLTRSLGRNEITISPAKKPRHNSAHDVHHLCEVQLVAVCSPNFQRPEKTVDLETLLSFALLQDSHHRWESLMEHVGHTEKLNIMNFDRSALTLDAALQGHGVAIAPTYMVEMDVRNNRLVEIWRPRKPTGETLSLSCAKQHARSKSVKQVIDWIRSEFDTHNNV